MVLIAVRADIVCKMMPLLHVILHIKAEKGLFSCSEKVVNDTKSFLGIKLHTQRAQAGKMRYEVRTDTGEVGSGVLDAFLHNRYCHILILNNGIGTCCLLKQYSVVLFSVSIKSVILHVHENLILEIKAVKPSVVDSYFRGGSAVKGIKKLRVFKKHHLLVRA